jgi:hypothetical protein
MALLHLRESQAGKRYGHLQNKTWGKKSLDSIQWGPSFSPFLQLFCQWLCEGFSARNPGGKIEWENRTTVSPLAAAGYDDVTLATVGPLPFLPPVEEPTEVIDG